MAVTQNEDASLDLEVRRADVEERLSELLAQRSRAAPEAAAGDEGVLAELADIDSQIAAAELELRTIDEVPGELERRERAAREQAEAEHRAALVERIGEGDAECARLAGACDEKLCEAAKSIAELVPAWNRRSAARGELQVAEGATSFDGGGSLTPRLQRAILFHLGAAGFNRGTVEFADAGYGALEPLMAKEQPTQEK